MPIDYDKLINWKIPEVEQRLTKRDTILYALGIGLGADPCDADQLKFVYEQDLRALPTLPQAALIYRLSGDYNPLHADHRFIPLDGSRARRDSAQQRPCRNLDLIRSTASPQRTRPSCPLR